MKTYGRSASEKTDSASRTTSSLWPYPYTQAVSTQLTPRSTARRIAATDSVSSCGPQPPDQPVPPTAQAPKPTRVMSMPVVPKVMVGRSVPERFEVMP